MDSGHICITPILNGIQIAFLVCLGAGIIFQMEDHDIIIWCYQELHNYVNACMRVPCVLYPTWIGICHKLKSSNISGTTPTIKDNGQKATHVPSWLAMHICAHFVILRRVQLVQ